MKFSSATLTLVAASSLVLPALAATLPVDLQSYETRDLSTGAAEQQLELRDLLELSGFSGELTERDLEDLKDLIARDPFIFKAFKIGRKVVSGIKNGFSAHNHHKNHQNNRNRPRDFSIDLEDIDGRDFIDDFDDVDARDYEDMEDLEARMDSYDHELSLREQLDALIELEERDPWIFKAFKIGKKVAKGIKRGVSANNQRKEHRNRRNRPRDLDWDFEDIVERETELDELD